MPGQPQKMLYEEERRVLYVPNKDDSMKDEGFEVGSSG